MAPTSDRERAPENEDAANPVSAHRSRPDRTVFTEEGNPDAWIATDLTIELRQ